MVVGVGADQDTVGRLVSEAGAALLGLGIGSLMNVIRELRRYEQHGAREDLPDARLIRSMAERLQADWKRYGLEDVYAFPEDMLLDSQRRHMEHRLLGFNLIRSNPKICGYNLTGMLDHGITGEGVWTFWREWKPEAAETLSDGWAPLRWCLFVDPSHGYRGRASILHTLWETERWLDQYIGADAAEAEEKAPEIAGEE